MRRAWFGWLLLPCLLLVWPERAHSRPAESEARPTAAPRALSVGLPWAGALRRGHRLSESPHVRHLPAHARRGNFWGTGELIGLLERGAAAVARRWPGSRLSVGELSARRGGWLHGHHSHRSGRDADIAFFMRDDDDGFARLSRFIGFGRRAPLAGAPARVRFDDARNWQLVDTLLDDPQARVQYLFVSKPVRARLLVEGRRRGASPERLQAAAAVMVEPRRGEDHADHFHVRIFCPAGHRPTCEDTAPYWPWYDGAPSDGFASLPRIRWR